MPRVTTIRHEFTDHLPDELDDGVAYVSMRYTVVVHMCCCGCRNKVVTPVNPEAWELTFDGKSISLYPSIGNRSLPCRSHYWIRRNRIDWLGSFPEPGRDAHRRLGGLRGFLGRFIPWRFRGLLPQALLDRLEKRYGETARPTGDNTSSGT